MESIAHHLAGTNARIGMENHVFNIIHLLVYCCVFCGYTLILYMPSFSYIINCSGDYLDIEYIINTEL